MIVCSCHSISEQHLARLAREGASDEEVVRATRAGTSCGACRAQVRDVLATSRGGCGKKPACPGCPRRAA